MTPRATDYYKQLGQRIRYERLYAGRAQEECAAHLCCSYQQMQKYERGLNRIPVDKIVRLAAFLNVPLASLLEISEDSQQLDHPRVALAVVSNLKLLSSETQEAVSSIVRSLAKAHGHEPTR